MDLNSLDDLYRDAILDHRRTPRNRQVIDNPGVVAHAINPFCGDEVRIQLQLSGNDRVKTIGLQSEGCSINIASGSMLTESIKNRPLVDIFAISQLFRASLGEGSISNSDTKRLGALLSLQAVKECPIRIKCALLAWTGLEDAIENHIKGVTR